MPSTFPPHDLAVLEAPGVIAWLAALATTGQGLADARDEAGLAAAVRRLAIPVLADFCKLYVVDSDGRLNPIVESGLEPATPFGQLHAHEATSPPATAGLARIARQGALLALHDSDGPTWLDALTDDADHLARLQALGLTSVVLAPLTTRATVVGLLLLGTTNRSRPDGDAVTSLIGLLASMASAGLAAAASARHEAALNARVDVLVQAARELAHVVNNDLTLPVGAIEIMIDRPDNPPELLEMLTAAASDLAAAEEHIRGFHQIARSEAPLVPRQGPPLAPGPAAPGP